MTGLLKKTAEDFKKDRYKIIQEVKLNIRLNEGLSEKQKELALELTKLLIKLEETTGQKPSPNVFDNIATDYVLSKQAEEYAIKEENGGWANFLKNVGAIDFGVIETQIRVCVVKKE